MATLMTNTDIALLQKKDLTLFQCTPGKDIEYFLFTHKTFQYLNTISAPTIKN